MQQRLSREANRYAFKAPLTLPYLELPQSSPGLPSHFLKIHVDIVLPSTPRSCKWFLSLKPPHQNPARTSPVSHTCHMPRPPDHPNSIWWGIHITMVLVMRSSPLPCLVPLRPTRLPQHPQPMFFPQRDRPSFTRIQGNRQKITVPYILIFVFLDSKLEDKKLYTECQQAFPDFHLLLILS